MSPLSMEFLSGEESDQNWRVSASLVSPTGLDGSVSRVGSNPIWDQAAECGDHKNVAKKLSEFTMTKVKHVKFPSMTSL